MEKQNNLFVLILSGVLICALGVFALPKMVQATYQREPSVKIFSNSGVQEGFLTPFTKTFMGGVQVVAADVDKDGKYEMVVAAGAGGAPHIRVLQGDGSMISDFFAYDTSMRAGVNIAVGDLDGDNIPEIVTAPKFGGAPHVRVFDIQGHPKFSPGFFAYDELFRGGVNVAVGDLSGDGSNEIITGAGPSGGPHVRYFDRAGNALGGVFPFHQDFRGGINVGVANVDGGDDDELIVSVAGSDSPWVKVMKINGHEKILGHFLAFDKSFIGGVNLAGGDVDGDGVEEIVVAVRGRGAPHVRIFEGTGKLASNGFFAYEGDFRGGVNISVGNITGSGQNEILAGPSSWQAEGRQDLIKYVEVNLTEQRLYAYEYGRIINTFLVSTGLRGMDTRTGTFSISQKIPVKLYSGSDYYLPNTKWNMRFDGSRLLHGAYWHNNFGQRMSHGCVNIAYDNAEWLYNWSELGTTVIVHN